MEHLRLWSWPFGFTASSSPSAVGPTVIDRRAYKSRSLSSRSAINTPTAKSLTAKSLNASGGGLFWRRHNRVHKEWPLEPGEPFDFLTLAAVQGALFGQKKKEQLWAVSVGGPDDATSPLKGMRGVAFDIRQKMLAQFSIAARMLGAVTPSSFVDAVRQSAVPKRFDVLKIDMDGFDCDLLESLTTAGYRPAVVIIEANPAWPPPIVWRRNYSPRWTWGMGGSFFYGCSLQAVTDLLNPLGYGLLQYTIDDAWLVRHDAVPRGGLRGLLPGGSHWLSPATAFRRGNPHFFTVASMLYEPGKRNMSKLLLDNVGWRLASRGGSQLLLETVHTLLKEHNGEPVPEDIPHVLTLTRK